MFIVVALLALTNFACDLSIINKVKNESNNVQPQKIGEPVEFQLYSGNESLPPEYQTVLIIRGKIEPDKILVNYKLRDKGAKTERDLTLEGEDYQKYVAMVRRTNLEKKEFRAGGGAFDVTLIDKGGKHEMGAPTNGDEWSEFAQAVKRKIEVSK